MKKYKYCQHCEKGTMQHSEKRYCDSKPHPIERAFLTIFSGGVFEACLDKYWICAECGNEEKNND